jgi:hypothetical protein
MRFVIKLLVSALVIATASEVSKRSSVMGAILTALPLTSILVAVWLYTDTGSSDQVSRLMIGIAWMILPSFVFILGLPLILRAGVPFVLALLLSLSGMLICYFPYVRLLRKFGINF